MATYLVLGASGNVGRALSALLEGEGHTVRGTTSRTPGAGQVRLDLRTGEGLVPALTGVDGAFLLSPPGHVRQDELLQPVIEAARQLRVPRVVLMTAMGADADPNGPLRKAERQLEESEIASNVVRPNWFMQNFHTYWRHGIVTQGAVHLPTGDAKGSFIDARDIAAVVAQLLRRDDLAGQAFDLTGGEALDHAQVAAILSRVTGRAIRYDDVSATQMRELLLGAGLPSDYAEMMLVILEYFRLGVAARVTDAVQQVTGQAPRRFEDYAREHRAAWVP